MKQRGNITKRGKNSWQLKFDVTRKDGKRQTRYATAKGTRQDAQKELTRLLGAADADALPDPTRATVGEYIRKWLAGAHAQRSPKTVERYTELAGAQIIPHLGSERLQKLKPERVTAWHGELLEKGLSARTVGHAHRLLRVVLNYAVKNGTLTRNVASIHAAPKVEEDEIQILEEDQVTAVREALEGHTLYLIASLALATGMRRGELLGLQWGDVDLDGATLQVERSVEETKAGLRLKPPKTKRGKRSITLPPETVSLLQAHKLETMKTRLAIGLGKITDDTPVLGDIEGKLVSPHSISRAWRIVCIQKRLPRVPFHALRHTHVSMLIRKGVDILTISRRLGHSKASITLDVYGHLIKGGDAAAAKAIAEVLK